MTLLQQLSILAVLSYFIGAIPFGLIVGLSRGIDPRKAGSGNIGATNVGRLLGGRFFAIVFLLDMLKSLIPMLVAGLLVRLDDQPESDQPWQVYLAWLLVGFAAVIGHMFSVFLKFKGGKGVAASAGLILGLYPYYTLPAAVAILIFILVFSIWRYVSLASMLAASAFPLLYLAFGYLFPGWGIFGAKLPLLIFAFLVAALIVFRHRTNISRLIAGTENRVGKSA